MQGAEVSMQRSLSAGGKRAFTSYETIGVVVAVSAFNHPLNLIVHQVVPAIALGCRVIVKPAEATPLCCLDFVDLIQQAGLPDGWVQACVCTNDVAEMLVTSAQINFFSFIGSAKVGWYLKSKLAPGVRCALEHGGVAPTIVDKSADLEATVASLLRGAFYHAGQVCVSTQRIFAESTVVAILAKKMAEGAAKLKVGNALLEATEVGPLINRQAADRVEAWVQEAITSGANCLQGGHRISDHLYAPTVLLSPSTSARVSTEEIFGPVVSIYGYRDLDAAIAQANSLDVAFQAAVFAQNVDIVKHCFEHLDATAVMVNENSSFRVDWMPFGGRHTSGYGMGGMSHTMRDLLQLKMMVF
jgi:acyl-CoA reductase-like NAD-dependent aldehyde dehydrogenase